MSERLWLFEILHRPHLVIFQPVPQWGRRWAGCPTFRRCTRLDVQSFLWWEKKKKNKTIGKFPDDFFTKTNGSLRWFRSNRRKRGMNETGQWRERILVKNTETRQDHLTINAWNEQDFGWNKCLKADSRSCGASREKIQFWCGSAGDSAFIASAQGGERRSPNSEEETSSLFFSLTRSCDVFCIQTDQPDPETLPWKPTISPQPRLRALEENHCRAETQKVTFSPIILLDITLHTHTPLSVAGVCVWPC